MANSKVKLKKIDGYITSAYEVYKDGEFVGGVYKTFKRFARNNTVWEVIKNGKTIEFWTRSEAVEFLASQN
jgi:hypothetical protein